MDVLDRAMLAQLRGLPGARGGPLLGEVIDTFLQLLPGQLALIAAALREGDAQAAAHAAHSLRGSASALGALRLAEACAALESRAERGAAEPALLPAIESAAAEAGAALSDERTG